MSNQEFIKVGEDQKPFTINRWGTREQIKNMPKIGSVFAVPIAHALQAGILFRKDTLTVLTSDQYNIIPTALQMLFNQLEDEGTEELFELLLSGVKYQKASVTLDSFDDISELLEVIAKVLEVNYKSLFMGKGLMASLQMVVPMTQQNLQSEQP